MKNAIRLNIVLINAVFHFILFTRLPLINDSMSEKHIFNHRYSHLINNAYRVNKCNLVGPCKPGSVHCLHKK